MKKLLFFFLACSFSLFSGSIRLYNDSPYKLRSVIFAGDGTYLGEMIMLPEHTNTWSSEYQSFGPGGQNYSPNPSRSQTPYTVHWHCPDGSEFGINQNVAAGALVSSGSAEGAKLCKISKKKQKNPYGATEDDEQLQERAQKRQSELNLKSDSETGS